MWCVLGELGSIDDDASAAKETPTTSGLSLEDWEIKEGGGGRLKGGTGVAGGYHTGNGIVHAQSKELTLKHHLKLMAGRMVKFNVKGGQ